MLITVLTASAVGLNKAFSEGISMSIVKAGIIGIGNIGSFHLVNILAGKISGMSVTAVCDTDKEKLKQLRESRSDIRVFENYIEMLRLADINAVIIAVPHPLHSEMAIAAFESGKHVLVEKPIDISVSAAERLNTAAKNSGKKFAVMFNQRTNELFKEARRIVKSGELGELKRSVWIITNWYRTQSYYNSGSWRATWLGEGGGVLLNQAPHNLDIWQWICGMPVSVTAFCNVAKYHNIEVEDEAILYTEYENGATGVFITSTGDCPGSNRFEITGTRGKIVLENGILKFWSLKEDERGICFDSEEGFANPETVYSEFKGEAESAHVGILQNFTNAILSGEELLSPGYDGIYELTISNAAYLSEWKGNQKIKLPFNCAEYDGILSEKRRHSALKYNTVKTDEDKSCRRRWQVNW